jgi:hypothetical protein
MLRRRSLAVIEARGTAGAAGRAAASVATAGAVAAFEPKNPGTTTG